MKNLKKKGFTIVELVIVIAVIAVLAAVLIPTFVNLTRKANISADTVLAKNLNTALAVYDAENDIKDFDDVLEAIKEHGYLIANLNAKADGCYFVWESETNQILLVDSTERYKVLYSAKDGYATPDNSWYFAISNKEKAGEVALALPNVNVKQTIANIEDFKEILTSGGEVYIDESVVLSEDNLIEVQNSDVILNLGSSSLNTNGVIENQFPIYVESGKLTLNGGVIGASGSSIDVDGDRYTTPLVTENGTYTKINGTTFNINSSSGFLIFSGQVEVLDAKINSEGQGIHTSGSGNITLENVTIKAEASAIWACNLDYTDNTQTTTGHIGVNKTTIISGTYEGGNSTYGVITSCGGDLVIKGGTFISNGSELVSFVDPTGSVSIQGGTFNINPSEFVDLNFYQVTENNGMWTVKAK